MSDIRESGFWQNLLKKIVGILAKGLGGKKRKVSQRHQHVVPHDEGWAVRGEGNKRYTAVYKYQDDAIGRARDIAKNYGSDVVVHGRDGRIRDRMNYDKRD